MIDVVFAHPYPKRSRANRALLDGIEGMSGVEVRSLYERYPDFSIDVEAEQQALVRAELVVWQHPMYWYSVPGMLKHWFDKVLARGWAYGSGGTALRGKRCLWVVTTGGEADEFDSDGMHAHSFDTFEPVIRQTAKFCGMQWLEPLIVHGAHRLSDEDLTAAGKAYRARLASLR